MTIYNLIDAVDRDEKSHRIKELTILLIAAMNDWPTFNLTDIDEFVKELKDFFGTPLATDKINSKPLNLGVQHNAWRHEAGASIAEMIDMSTTLDNEPNFDKIIERILNYYKSDEDDSTKVCR